MKLYLAVVAGNLGLVSIGLFYGWASPSLPILLQNDSPVKMTIAEGSWVVALFNLGGALGSLTCNFVVNIIGRKQSLLLTALPSIISWMMIAFATTTWELYVARLLCGVSTGMGYVAAAMYFGEISPANIRGIVTATLTVASKFGTFVELAIGPFLSVRDLALVSCSLPVLFFVTFVWLPESPYHLMRRGRHADAIKSLKDLRGDTDIDKEAGRIEDSVRIDLTQKTGLWEILSVPGNRRALIISTGLVSVQQWSGSLAILSYAEMIFDETDNNLEGKYLSIILGFLQVISTIVCTMIVDRFGRRPLLIFSTVTSAFSTGIVGLYFFLRDIDIDVSGIGWLPVTGVLLYTIVYSFGLSALPFTVMGEVFPTNVKGLGNSLTMFTCKMWAYVVTVSYQSIADTFGIYTAFWIFTVVTLFGLLFIIFYVPETKGKTLQEIQLELHNRDVY